MTPAAGPRWEMTLHDLAAPRGTPGSFRKGVGEGGPESDRSHGRSCVCGGGLGPPPGAGGGGRETNALPMPPCSPARTALQGGKTTGSSCWVGGAGRKLTATADGFLHAEMPRKRRFVSRPVDDRETHLARDVQRLCRSLSTPTRPGPAEAVGPRARWVGQAPRSPFSAARPAADPRRRPLRPPHFLAHTEERHRLPGALRASEDRSGCTPLTRQD